MEDLFDIKGKVVVVTGAAGALTGALSKYLAAQGARLALLGRTEGRLKALLAEISSDSPDSAYFTCDVTDKDSLEGANEKILSKFGRIDALINGAGGNMPGAVIGPSQSFFDLDFDQWRSVMDLNLGGVLLSTLAFAKIFEKQKNGAIVNFSSMAARSALTRVLGYSNAKAGIDNLTKWLAVEFAKKIGEGVRVNAIAPGFFIGEQNRRLLLNGDGTPTDRGAQVIAKTPFGRFGKADEICGAVHFLISGASKFVTGTVVPIDGGFSAYTGV